MSAHVIVEVRKIGPRYVVCVTPVAYGMVEFLSTEANDFAQEINKAAAEARRLNNPPRPFYK